MRLPEETEGTIRVCNEIGEQTKRGSKEEDEEGERQSEPVQAEPGTELMGALSEEGKIYRSVIMHVGYLERKRGWRILNCFVVHYKLNLSGIFLIFNYPGCQTNVSQIERLGWSNGSQLYTRLKWKLHHYSF